MNSFLKIFIPDAEHRWLLASKVNDDGPELLLAQLHRPQNVEVIIEDPIVCSVISKDAIHKHVSYSDLPNGWNQFPLQNCYENDDGLDDMKDLNHLHEASVMENLRRRFNGKRPYTYCGEVCVAVNPYEKLDLYTPSLMRDYASCVKKSDLPPHIFGTSALALTNLKESMKESQLREQIIIISGESGSGKTESVKVLMNHIALMCGNNDCESNSPAIKMMLKTNPLLECFGNARTSFNDNSSRFGKLIRLQFDESATFVGSVCETLLLEKNRVVNQFRGDSNYHIFHQIIAAPETILALLQLEGKQSIDFRILGNGQNTMYPNALLDTVNLLKDIGVPQLLIDSLLQGIGGILYLTEIGFDLRALDNSENFDEFIRKSALLLGIDSHVLIHELSHRTITVEGNKIQVQLTQEQKLTLRDALAKEVYSLIFSWLVETLNLKTNCVKASNSHCIANISLLDIFGFECFASNRFDQLCINYINEKLQHKFTNNTIKSVQAEYLSEKISWELIEFKDNSNVIDLLDGKGGIFVRLKEECTIPQGNEASYLAKLKNAFPSSQLLSFDRIAKDIFTIRHFAGSVTYNISGFIEQNKDNLSTELSNFMAKSTNALVKIIFNENFTISSLNQSQPDTEQGLKKATSQHSRNCSFINSDCVLSKIKLQLSQLIQIIDKAEVHYVRCIKPNLVKSCEIFSRAVVIDQLRSSGLIEALRISRASYPNYLFHCEFKLLFKCFAFAKTIYSSVHYFETSSYESDPGLSTIYQVCIQLIKVYNSSASALSIQLGLTKIYFREGILELLESLKLYLLNQHAIKLQSFVRRCLRRKIYCRLLNIITQLQLKFKMRLRKRNEIKRNASLIIQRSMKKLKISRDKRRLLFAIKLQSFLRMKRAEISYLTLQNKARCQVQSAVEIRNPLLEKLISLDMIGIENGNATTSFTSDSNTDVNHCLGDYYDLLSSSDAMLEKPKHEPPENIIEVLQTNTHNRADIQQELSMNITELKLNIAQLLATKDETAIIVLSLNTRLATVEVQLNSLNIATNNYYRKKIDIYCFVFQDSLDNINRNCNILIQSSVCFIQLIVKQFFDWVSYMNKIDLRKDRFKFNCMDYLQIENTEIAFVFLFALLIAQI
eukprot:gene4428-6262_t